MPPITKIVVDITPILNLYDFEFAVAGAFANSLIS